MREMERVMLDPENKWAWYEFWKRMEPKELEAAVEGMQELPEWARKGIEG